MTKNFNTYTSLDNTYKSFGNMLIKIMSNAMNQSIKSRNANDTANRLLAIQATGYFLKSQLDHRQNVRSKSMYRQGREPSLAGGPGRRTGPAGWAGQAGRTGGLGRAAVFHCRTLLRVQLHIPMQAHREIPIENTAAAQPLKR